MDITSLLPRDPEQAKDVNRIKSIKNLLGDLDGVICDCGCSEDLLKCVHLGAALAMLAAGDSKVKVEDFSTLFGDIQTRDRAIKMIDAAFHALNFAGLSARHYGKRKIFNAVSNAVTVFTSINDLIGDAEISTRIDRLAEYHMDDMITSHFCEPSRQALAYYKANMRAALAA